MARSTRLTIANVSLAVAALLLTATTVAASGPPVAYQDATSFFDDDPCTPGFDPGEHEVSLQITGRIHMFETPSGGLHVSVHEQADISTSSGYAGRGVNNLSLNVSCDGTAESFTFSLNHSLRHPDGRVIRPHVVVHATVVDGELVTEFFKGAVSCVRTAD